MGKYGDTLGHQLDGCDRCRAYQRAANRNWRRRNPGQVTQNVQATQEKKREFVREIIGTVCVECGEDRLVAIQYHHSNEGVRQRYTSGKRVPLFYLPWKDLKEEIMGLIALCGTCHLVRHKGVA